MKSTLKLQPQAVVVEKIESKPIKAQDLIKGKYFQCEKILDFRIDKNRRSYLIKWRFYNDEENTWELITNLASTAYELAKFEQLNKEYIKQIEANWLQREMKNKKRKFTGVPHFTRELQLLSAFAQGYLNFDENELEEKLAIFIQEIQRKQTKKRIIGKKNLNTTSVQSKTERPQHKSINKSFNQAQGNIKQRYTRAKQKSFLEASKSKEKSKQSTFLPICPVVKQSRAQLKYNNAMRHGAHYEAGKEKKFFQVSRQIQDQNNSILMSEMSFGNITQNPLAYHKQKPIKKVQEIPSHKFSTYSFRQVIKQKEVENNKESPNRLIANDGTILMVPDLLHALLTTTEIEEKKINCKQVVRYYRIQDEILYELRVEINGLQKNVYINYTMMKSYFSPQLIQYLEKFSKVFQ